VGTWQNGFTAGPQIKSTGATTYEWRVSLGYKVVSATGTFTAAKIVTNNPYWAATIATFKGATLAPRPTAVVSGSATICNGGTNTIQAALTGTGPWNLTWSDGATQNGVASSPATRDVSPSVTTTYTVTALNDTNCGAEAGDLTGSAVVTVQSAFEAWQLQYFGCTNCPEALATSDPDGDGQDNQAEFLAGFNPNSNVAYLRIISIVQSSNDLVVTYLGANGDTSYACGPTTRTNVLEFTAGAGSQGSYTNNFVSTGLTNVLSGGSGAGTNVVVTDVGGATNNSSRYYRVRVLVP
jgi:hypothetical protein